MRFYRRLAFLSVKDTAKYQLATDYTAISTAKSLSRIIDSLKAEETVPGRPSSMFYRKCYVSVSL